MVKNSGFKQKVRARMESDGVSYAEARRRVLDDREKRAVAQSDRHNQEG